MKSGDRIWVTQIQLPVDDDSERFKDWEACPAIERCGGPSLFFATEEGCKAWTRKYNQIGHRCGNIPTRIVSFTVSDLEVIDGN